MKEVLFRLQKLDSRPLTCFWPAWTLLGFHACLQAQQVRQDFRQEKEWVCQLSPWRSGQSPWGLTKPYDSQGETNSIVKKVKIKPELHFSTQIEDAISLQPGIIRGNLGNFSLKSLQGWTHHPRPFSNWDSRLLLMRDLPAPSLDVGRPNLVMNVLLLYCFCFFSWLDTEIKSNSLL